MVKQNKANDKSTAEMSAPVVTMQATAKQTATLIFLHGLGDTGHGWAQAMVAVRPPYMKVICPTAPTIPVTLNAGFRMPSWFDIRSLDMFTPEDEPGINQATNDIHSLIQTEVQAGIAPGRIFLGGFSQGGALALYAGLTYTKPLAGIIGLSCWLPIHKSFPGAKKVDNTVPIFQCHGDVDPVVPYKLGQLSHLTLKTFMTNAQFTTYNGLSHSSSDQELDDMKDFIHKYIQPQ